MSKSALYIIRKEVWLKITIRIYLLLLILNRINHKRAGALLKPMWLPSVDYPSIFPQNKIANNTDNWI
jgi:hypothetical protein